MKPTFLKTITFLAICLCSLNNYAQTKEETISWLQEKLSESVEILNNKVLNNTGAEYTIDLDYYRGSKVPENKVIAINISECNIEFKLLVREKENVSMVHPVTLNIPIRGTEISGWWFKNDVVPTHFTYKGKDYFNDFPQLIIINKTEEDLYKRIENAFKHLATFCPKKKETF